MSACDRLIFEAMADWYTMHAAMEGMPIEQWRLLAKGQPEAARFPEVQRSIQLLLRAAGSFRAGAELNRELLAQPNPHPLGRALTKEVRASIETNIAAYQQIAARIDEMAGMLEKSRAPTIEFVQGIEQLMTRQHAVMDQRSRELGILAELQHG